MYILHMCLHINIMEYYVVLEEKEGFINWKINQRN